MLRDDTEPDRRTPTDSQVANLKWYARFKRREIPENCYDDSGALWAFLYNSIDRVDLDIAAEMCIDFRLRFDHRNPFSVIGCLKYYDKVIQSELLYQEEQRKAAKKMILNGDSPWDVAKYFYMYDREVHKIVVEIEAEGIEITNY